MKLELSSQIFKKNSSITFRKILSPNSRVVPCGQDVKWVDGWTEYNEAVTFHILRTRLIKNEHGSLAKHWREKTTALPRNTCHSATFSTTNPMQDFRESQHIKTLGQHQTSQLSISECNQHKEEKLHINYLHIRIWWLIICH